MPSPRQRAHRILKALKLFIKSDEIPDTPPSIEAQGGVIGVYNPNSTNSETTIWISDDGIWIFDKEWVLICYSDVLEVNYPESKQDTNDFLFITLRNGARKLVPVVGRVGRMRDVYEIGRFLQRSAQDVSAKNST